MKKQFTKEQKAEYFANLRQEWQAAKQHAVEHQDEIGAIIQNHGLNISQTGFSLVSAQMSAHGFDGLPYLDVKTFNGWKDNGYKVKKGEKSVLHSLVWIGAGTDEDDDDGYVFPKMTVLFHRSQVEEI